MVGPPFTSLHLRLHLPPVAFTGAGYIFNIMVHFYTNCNFSLRHNFRVLRFPAAAFRFRPFEYILPRTPPWPTLHLWPHLLASSLHRCRVYLTYLVYNTALLPEITLINQYLMQIILHMHQFSLCVSQEVRRTLTDRPSYYIQNTIRHSNTRKGQTDFASVLCRIC